MGDEPEEKNGSIHFMTLFNRQGKTRLAKWYKPFSTKAKTRMLREMNNLILSRRTAMCNVLEWKGMKLVYKRYASLYFVACIDMNFNELITLEIIHMFVETLDRYFGNVCELDIIFNFHKAYYLLDELVMGGELQETNKKEVLDIMAQQEDSVVNESALGGKKKGGGDAYSDL